MLKVLGDGELTKKLKISAHRFSKSALEKIEQAGGEAVVLPGKSPGRQEQAKAEANANRIAAVRAGRRWNRHADLPATR